MRKRVEIAVTEMPMPALAAEERARGPEGEGERGRFVGMSGSEEVGEGDGRGEVG